MTAEIDYEHAIESMCTWTGGKLQWHRNGTPSGGVMLVTCEDESLFAASCPAELYGSLRSAAMALLDQEYTFHEEEEEEVGPMGLLLDRNKELAEENERLRQALGRIRKYVGTIKEDTESIRSYAQSIESTSINPLGK